MEVGFPFGVEFHSSLFSHVGVASGGGGGHAATAAAAAAPFSS